MRGLLIIILILLIELFNALMFGSDNVCMYIGAIFVDIILVIDFVATAFCKEKK